MKMTLKIKADKKYYSILDTMSEISSYLYNQINYAIRMNYFNHTMSTSELLEKNIPQIKFSKKYLNFKQSELYQYVKSLNHYKNLPNSLSQNIALKIDKNYKSFFELLKLKQSGTYDEKISLPKYKKGKDLFNFTMSLTKNNFRVQLIDNQINIVITTPKQFQYINNNQEYKSLINEFGKISLSVPLNIFKGEIKSINQIEYKKYNNNWYYNITYTTEFETSNNVDYERICGIDLGLNNLSTIIDYKGNGLIINGKPLKSRNNHYNKLIAKLNSKIDTDKNKEYKNKLKKIKSNVTKNRNRYVNDYLHKTSNKIINHCKEHDIQTIVIGQNKGWKNKINIGKKNNQKFVGIPHSRLIELIKYKGEMNNINVETQEESYTSKVDHLAMESFPRKNKRKSSEYLGKRKFRGLYQSSKGILLNADINGAIGIVRKFQENVFGNFVQFLEQIINSRLFLNPVKVNIY